MINLNAVMAGVLFEFVHSVRVPLFGPTHVQILLQEMLMLPLLRGKCTVESEADMGKGWPSLECTEIARLCCMLDYCLVMTGGHWLSSWHPCCIPHITTISLPPIALAGKAAGILGVDHVTVELAEKVFNFSSFN